MSWAECMDRSSAVRQQGLIQQRWLSFRRQNSRCGGKIVSWTEWYFITIDTDSEELDRTRSVRNYMNQCYENKCRSEELHIRYSSEYTFCNVRLGSQCCRYLWFRRVYHRSLHYYTVNWTDISVENGPEEFLKWIERGKYVAVREDC